MAEKNYTIELDCAPGGYRPSDALKTVLAGLPLTLDPDKPQAAFFGEWTWVIPEDQVESFLASRDTIKERISSLYNSGLIRYGSW